MIKELFNFVASVACVSLVVGWSVDTGVAADKANYSGKYSLQRRKTGSGIETESTLTVVQNDDSIVITREEGGKRTTNRYLLNGSEGDYTSPGGVPGKCKAQFKGKYLVLESVVVSRPDPSGPPVRLHTKERLQLSADSKTLTVKSDEDFPDFPGDISAVLVGEYALGTQRYTRANNP